MLFTRIDFVRSLLHGKDIKHEVNVDDDLDPDDRCDGDSNNDGDKGDGDNDGSDDNDGGDDVDTHEHHLLGIEASNEKSIQVDALSCGHHPAPLYLAYLALLHSHVLC